MCGGGKAREGKALEDKGEKIEARALQVVDGAAM